MYSIGDIIGCICGCNTQGTITKIDNSLGFYCINDIIGIRFNSAVLIYKKAKTLKSKKLDYISKNPINKPEVL